MFLGCIKTCVRFDVNDQALNLLDLDSEASTVTILEDRKNSLQCGLKCPNRVEREQMGVSS